MSSAYVIASVHVTNAIEFEKYRLQVPSVTEGFGGKYLAPVSYTHLTLPTN